VALTIGILFGIYSSVFVAAAIAMWLGVKREDLVKTSSKEIDPERPERRGCGVEFTNPCPASTHSTSMATAANSLAMAAQARRSYVEGVLNGLPAWCRRSITGPHPAEPSGRSGHHDARRDVVEDLPSSTTPGCTAPSTRCVPRCRAVGSPRQAPDLPRPAHGRLRVQRRLSLVDNDTIESEILSSRLALAMMDRASWEFTDMRSRITMLEGRDELDPNDVLRPHVVARIVTNAWRQAGLSHDAWRTCRRCCTMNSPISPKRRITRPTAG
jgi:hypothetical protein